MGVGRAAGVLPCCAMANLMRPLSRRMGWRMQVRSPPVSSAHCGNLSVCRIDWDALWDVWLVAGNLKDPARWFSA